MVGVSKCEAVGDKLAWKGQMWSGCPAMQAPMKPFENTSG